jgi:formamidopyrimidine-DNA glycosylase
VPELPEVETTRRGIAPWIEGERATEIVVRERRLRWPVPAGLARTLEGRRLERVDRRAKYLILRWESGSLLLHLGMSGSLRVLTGPAPPGRHDHLDIGFAHGRVLRFNDPRRFGSVHWTRADPARHPLLADLGPEPLGPDFTGAHLYGSARGRRVAVKPHLMNSRVVVGVGNIYASEALFRAGIHPRRPAGRISLARMERLAGAVREVLSEAIEQGGTTLRDFTWGDGRPGYFQQSLAVYGRAGEPCPTCERPLSSEVLGQRATYFCGRCQR